MFLQRIRIANFKSLKDVEITPSGLVALVGPNGAGKTNFALAMKFLAEVHQHGLETAIARAGGIENIALRKMRRTKSPIAFEAEVRCNWREIPWAFPRRGAGRVPGFTLRHGFRCKAASGGIRAEFSVVGERFEVAARPEQERALGGGALAGRYAIWRDAHGKLRHTGLDPLLRRAMPRRDWNLLRRDIDGGLRRARKQSLFSSFALAQPFMPAYSQFISSIGVFHFSPAGTRDSGAPTPSPTFGMLGNNLPALVDWLRRKHKGEWRQVLEGMRDVVPGLEDISVQVLPSKTLGLFFAEEGIGRPWRADEVSDGTMHALSLLVACADPRVSALVIEEPENSLHPWALKELGKRLRKLAKTKTVMVTTQSPVFIDLLYPSEVWIVSRAKGHTSIRRLTEIDSRIEQDWREGDVGLSEYLDAGLVPRAVPGGGES